MAYHVQETDPEEAERVAKAVTDALRGPISRLKPVAETLPRASMDRFTIERLHRDIVLCGKNADQHDVEQVKTLSWKYRRQLPCELAPKLPPHDPCVREMQARGG